MTKNFISKNSFKILLVVAFLLIIIVVGAILLYHYYLRGDFGNYLSGIGSLILALLTIPGIAIAAMTYKDDLKKRYDQRNEFIYEKYMSHLMTIQHYLELSKSAMHHSYRSMKEPGEVVTCKVEGQEVIRVLYQHFDIINKKVSENNLKFLSEQDIVAISNNLQNQYEEAFDPNILDVLETRLRNLDSYNEDIIIHDYGITKDWYNNIKESPNKEKEIVERIIQHVGFDLTCYIEKIQAMLELKESIIRIDRRLGNRQPFQHHLVAFAFSPDDKRLINVLSHVYPEFKQIL